MCKSHTKKIGALKLSQQDVGKNCFFRGCANKRKQKKVNENDDERTRKRTQKEKNSKEKKTKKKKKMEHPPDVY